MSVERLRAQDVETAVREVWEHTHAPHRADQRVHTYIPVKAGTILHRSFHAEVRRWGCVDTVERQERAPGLGAIPGYWFLDVTFVPCEHGP